MRLKQKAINKVKSLEELTALAEQWHAAGETVGVASGVFDFHHPGHGSFLEDVSERCDRLIIIIASDRTVKEQKGDLRPFTDEHMRARGTAQLEMVDASYISDELYHETLLKAIKPDFMFKGDDYQGKKIFGAEHVGEVVIVPCQAAYKHASTSRFMSHIHAIVEAEKDKAKSWVARQEEQEPASTVERGR